QGNIDDYARLLAGYNKELGYISIRTTQRYHQIPIYWKADRFEKINVALLCFLEANDIGCIFLDRRNIQITAFVPIVRTVIMK
ncbi:MAG: hypothetical protein AAFR67_09050, partial [Chloroflexota bacterium]